MATSRSLGTLTLDLVARISGFVDGMTKAERAADKSQRNIAKQARERAKEVDTAWDKAGKAIGAAFAAISVGAVATQLAGVAKETANLAIEFDKLSALSGTSNDSFQRMAAGASTVGISAEKLADIFKDVQDKAGDFAQTGGGGMADFFENIAPKVGVTIEQFRKLSGPEAMQLYVSSLEKAKLSQQDMIFYMEALASDSALLLPLLKSNGSEWERLGQAAADAGAIMGDKALQAARDYNTEAQNLERAMQGLRVEVMEQLLPSMTELTGTMANEASRAAFATMIGWMGQLASTTVSLTANLLAFINAKDRIGAMTGTDDFGKMTASAQEATARVTRLTDAYERHQEALSRDPGNVHLQRSVEKTRNLITQASKEASDASDALKKFAGAPVVKASELMGPPGSAASSPLSPVVSKPKGKTGKSDAQKEADKEIEAAKRYMATLRELADGRKEMNALEQLSYDLQEKRIKLSGADQANAEKLATLAIFRADGLERAQQAEQSHNDKMREGVSLTESLLTPTEKYAQQLAGLNDLLAAGSIAPETYGRAVDKYYKEMTDQTTDYTKQAAKNMVDILGDWLVTGLDGSFKDILASFANMLLKMEMQALSANVLGSFFGGSSGGTSILGGLFGGLFGGGRAHGGMVSPGKLYEVNENSPEMLSVGGRDYLMTGSQAGYVTPSGSGSGGSGAGGLTVNVPIAMDLGGGRAADPSTLENVGSQLSKAIKPAVQEEVARMMRPGGLLWSQSNGR